MKKLITATLICFGLLAASETTAQSMGTSYRTAIGAKGYFGSGSIGGINIKHFTSSTGALEGSVLFRERFFAFEGMYAWHGPIGGARGVRWYVGPGAQLGFWNDRYDNDDDDLFFALKGTLGIDVKFNGAPINIAFDVNPTFGLTPSTDFDFNAGLAFRFTF